MSFIDPIVKAVTFFKFLRPKTFVYGSFPQSIKSPSVTLLGKLDEAEEPPDEEEVIIPAVLS